MFLLLTLNIFYTFFKLSIVDFERVNVFWLCFQANIERSFTNGIVDINISLNHLKPMFHFYTPWSGIIEMEFRLKWVNGGYTHLNT